ncbi:hypothetical protein POW16_23310, partial [Raoultella planticola]
MLSCMALLYAGKSAAKPDMKPLGPNIADRGSAVYHFSVQQFDSADGKRHYRVWTGVPDRSPPPSGYPVLYMLDGNALIGLAPIFPDTFYRFTHYWFAAADIPV